MVSHLFSVNQGSLRECAGGVRVDVTKKNFALLRGMALYKLTLKPGAVREPHWHPNADELGYCLKGRFLISLYADYNEQTSFLVKEGEAFFIPTGTLHDIENVGKDEAEIILQFSHEEPEAFGLSAAFGMFSENVLGNTWDVAGSLFASLKRSTKDSFIVLPKEKAVIPREAAYPSHYRFALAESPPLVSNEGGSARVARHDVWPILKKQALYTLQLTGKGMREPHWHPGTSEMGYVVKGRGRMSILSPSGEVDTYVMNAGDLYFIPAAYPHHIENLQEENLDLCIFFDHAMPGDIGFTGSVKAYSDDLLAAALNGPKELFSSLPTYYKDAFIVKKRNPLD